jgi:acyl-coenzyme A synthetase/AMP-(fatty) acid ligase
MSHLAQKVTPTAYIGSTKYRDYEHVDTMLEVQEDVSSLEHVIAVGETPTRGVSFGDLVGTSSRGFTPDRLDPDYPDRLRHTGGTTGMPKPVYWSHNIRRAWIEPMVDWFGITKFDDILGLAPFPHGISTPLAFTGILLSGATSYLTDPGHDAQTYWEKIEEYEPSVITVAPTQLNKMANVSNSDDYSLDSVRLISFSGEPLPADTAEFFENKGPKVVSYYGSTEGGASFLVHPGERRERRHNTAGKPIPFVDLRVVDENGDPLGANEDGELVWSGPTLTYGYYDEPELTREEFVVDDNGVWTKSGDAGSYDDRGNIYVKGRVDDMILRGGENIFPAPIEDEIAKLDQVEEVAVVGMPDTEYGQRACAFVVASGELVLDDITSFLEAEGLAKYKWPERLELVDSLPQTAASKIDKVALEGRIKQTLIEEGRKEE